MRTRIWATVVVSASALILSSSAFSAVPVLSELFEQVRNLPMTVVMLASVSCIFWLMSLARLYRTWMVRRNLVRVLARFGAPPAVIANTARLSQDGVTFLTTAAGGNGGAKQ
jgi:hypothetical protein